MKDNINKCLLIQLANLLKDKKNMKKISSTKRWILFCLASYTNKKFQCWPSYANIASFTNLDKSTIKRNIREMELDGVLKIEERYSNKNRRTSNLITLSFDKISELMGAYDTHSGGIEHPGMGAQETPNITIEDIKEDNNSNNVVDFFNFDPMERLNIILGNKK